MAFRLAVAAPFDHPAFSSTGGTARQGTAFWKGSTREQQTWRAHRARSTVGDVRLWEPSMAAGRRESEKAQLKKNRLLAWARQLREQRPIVPLGKGMRGTSGLAIAGGRAVGDAPVAEICEKPFGPALKALAAACKYEYLAISGAANHLWPDAVRQQEAANTAPRWGYCAGSKSLHRSRLRDRGGRTRSAKRGALGAGGN